MPHPTDTTCIFCRIVAGSIPCHKLGENDGALSFLDIGPISRGHAIVVPKGHWVMLDQMPEDAVAACARLVRKVAAAVVAATDAGGWNLLQNNGSIAGQVVPHVHFHIIPRAAEDGLGYRWRAGELSKDDAAALLKTIKGAM